jgi:ankyrin repeat protein
MLAASKGHVDMVRLLLRSGALVNQQDARGRTALMEACAAGKTEVVTLLLEEGANAYVIDKSGKDAFQLACHEGHSTTFDRLWQKYTSSTHIYVKEEELLESAYESDRLDVFQMCMDEGLNPPNKLYEGEEGDDPADARVECSSVIEVSMEECD